jgi:GAF domain-containing protein
VKPAIEKPLPETNNWKCFLEAAETLLKKSSLKEQSAFICQSIAEIFGVKCSFWFAHPLYPLPGEDDPDMVNMKAGLDSLVMSTFANHEPIIQLADGTVTSNISDQSLAVKSSLPVISGNDLLGILLVQPGKSNQLDGQTLINISSLLSICAMPMQIYRLSVLKNWRFEQLSIVREVSDRIANITNIDQLCEKITAAVQEKFQYYYVAIFTCGEGCELLCRSSATMNNAQKLEPVIEIQPGQGIVGWVAEHKEELLVEDVTNHPVYKFHESLPETQSEVALPLMIGDRLLGVLDVQSDRCQTFHEMDMVVLRTLADNIAIAIEGAHLFSGLTRKSEQISTVYDISHSLSSILDLDLLLDEVVRTIQQKFLYLQVNVYTVHTGRGKIIFRAGTGENSQAYRDAFLTFDINDKEGILPRVAREGKTIISNDVRHDPLYRFPDFVTSTARSEMSVPLTTGGEITGILDIQSDQSGAFDENDRFLFEALSAGIATSIRNATLFRSEQFKRQVAESVRDVAGILSSDSSMEELMDRILEKLQENLPCDAASIWLTNPDPQSNKLLTLAAVRGTETHELRTTFQTAESAGPWVVDALHSDEPRIRCESDPRGPMGEALGFPKDYSAIAAPLRAGGETVGLLTLAHRQPDRYGSEARLITQTFAGYAAAAIQNSRLYASVREQAWVSTVLLKVAEASKEVKTHTELAETTVRLIPELVGCSSCALYYYNAPLNLYERKATRGFSADALPARTFSREHAAFVFACRLPTPIPAYYSHGDFVLTPVNDAPGGVIIPLKNRGQILGLFWIGNENRNRPFSKDTLQVLTGISNQTATALENLRLLENQQQDAFIAAALLQVAQTVSSKDDLQTVLDSILNLLSILAGTESAAFFLLNSDRQGFAPVTSCIGLDAEARRSLGTSLFPGDFPMLDLVTERNLLLLSPLGTAHKSAIHWSNIKQIFRLKDAVRQKAPEGGWLVGIPLSGKGEIFGALVILEKQVTGSLLEKRLDLLTGIARQAAMAIQNDLLQDKKLENEKLQQEFQFARDIQQAFLPRQLPVIKGWDVASLWQPARQVGGDFFDIFFSKPDTFCAVIADVSDKGMPAALYMTVTRTLIRSFAQENLSAGQILKKVNDLLLQDNPSGMFVTVAIVLGDQQTGIIQYANAGHNPPLIRTPLGTIIELPRGQIALGVMDNQEYADHSIVIERGSFLTLYTDGVTDTVSPGGDNYSQKRLIRLITNIKMNKASVLTSALENDLIQFRAGLPSVDDITVLSLHRI